MEILGVVFDMDGVLIDSEPVHIESWEILFQERGIDLEGIDWVIVGGESGPHARPMRPEWVEEILEQCEAADVPFFFKQWGGTNKTKAGRLLHGREWNGFPGIRPG